MLTRTQLEDRRYDRWSQLLHVYGPNMQHWPELVYGLYLNVCCGCTNPITAHACRDLFIFENTNLVPPLFLPRG